MGHLWVIGSFMGHCRHWVIGSFIGHCRHWVIGSFMGHCRHWVIYRSLGHYYRGLQGCNFLTSIEIERRPNLAAKQLSLTLHDF